ncbi:MAG TPA: HEPN domain-containing protein [Thermoplasmatales archaeon]|nr:HEPN domain-containing protein [Thermoplasmatales archaeon]
MNLEECFEKRLLRKIEPDYEKAKRSIEVAMDKLKKAKDAFDKKFLDACLLYGYTSMFHSARALLYKDGMQEKSHVCIVLYLKEKYSNEIPYYLIQSLDSFRKERHEALYGLDFEVREKDVMLAIKDAEEFIEVVKKLLK